MKKLFIIYNVFLLFVISSFGRVYAFENEYISYFNGSPVELNQIDPNGISLLYDVAGYDVQAFYVNNGSNQYFYQVTTLPNTDRRTFGFNITLPDTISQDNSFSIYANFTTNASLVGSNATLYLSNPQWGTEQSYSISAESLAGGFRISAENLTPNYTTKYIILNFTLRPSEVNTSLVFQTLDISIGQNNALLQGIYEILYLIYDDTSSIIGILNAIVDGLVGIINYLPNLAQDSTLSSVGSNIVSAINSGSSSIVSSINSMSSSLGNKIDNMKTTLNNSIVTMMNTLNNSLNDLLGENEDTTNATNENDSTTTDFENISGQYDDIEHSAVEDFENNLAKVDTDTDLLNVADFKSTSNFIATNLTNIYNSHDYIGNMIIFSLVIGFSLTLIGIKVRR